MNDVERVSVTFCVTKSQEDFTYAVYAVVCVLCIRRWEELGEERIAWGGLEDLPVGSIVVACSVAVIKHWDRGILQKEGFMWTYSSKAGKWQREHKSMTQSLNSQNHLQQLTSSHEATLLSLSKHCRRPGIKRSSAWDYGRLQTTTSSR